MFRIPSRQALSTPRYSVSSPLRMPAQARNLYDAAPPYSGPPSYETIALRFSGLYPSPIRYFAQKKANENIQRGQFVDIHDISGVGPKDYDVLIPDLNHEKLQSEISELVGIPFLEEATKSEADIVPEKIGGFIYGKAFHLILPCVLTVQKTSRWVFFIVHSGAPLTYISAQVAEAFGLGKETDPWLAKIAGYAHTIYVSPPDSHFASVNILGSDFCYLNKLRPWMESGRKVSYYIGDVWKRPEKKDPEREDV